MSNLYDVEAILETADPLDVARYIGMPIQEGKYYKTKKGRTKKTYYILCPGHKKRLGREDKHFGSAVLTERGYKCHACGSHVGVINMVMEYMECSFYNALGIIADSLGGRDKYLLNNDSAASYNSRRFPLTGEDLKLIGLYPYRSNTVDNLVCAGISQYMADYDAIKEKNSDNYDSLYLYYVPQKMSTMHSLYEEEREVFNWIIQNKVVELLQKLVDVEILLLDRNSPYFNLFTNLVKGKDGFWEDSELFFLRCEIKSMQQNCLNIIEKIRE